MEIVRSVNTSWIYDTYSSAYVELFMGGKVRGEKCPGEMSGYPDDLFKVCC